MSSIKSGNGKYWRSLGELEQSPEFQEYVDREFPKDASILEDPVSRRSFIKMMGASFAFAGLVGCAGIRKPKQLIEPYARTPENLVPGQGTYYATSISVGRDVGGLLVLSHEGRPTKIEGNPSHPMSQGAASPVQQASVLELYDPDRLKAIHSNITSQPSDTFGSWLSDRMTDAGETQGRGLALLIESVPSPTLHRVIKTFRLAYPEARVYQYDPLASDAERDGIYAVSGQYLRPVYRYEQIDRVVSIGADFLGSDPGNVANAKGFATRRDPDSVHGMNRLYVIESNFSVTGGKADHRIRIAPGQWDVALSQIASAVFAKRSGAAADLLAAVNRTAKSASSGFPADVLAAIVDDLTRTQLTSAVVAGPSASAYAHAVTYALNQVLGSAGTAVEYYPDGFAEYDYGAKDSVSALKSLTTAIRSGEVTSLYILGGNPAYTSPAEIGFADALRKLRHSVHLTLFQNETSVRCQWVVPRAHNLETWGDLKALDNTVSIVQPLIDPMYKGVSDSEFIAQFATGAKASGFDLVRETLKGKADGGFEREWRRWLHDGVVATGAAVTPPMASGTPPKSNPVANGDFQIEFVYDYKVLDGRFANNSWLQELPHPVTKLTWDNAALVSPATARQNGLKTGDLIQLKTTAGEIDAAVMVQPGNADGVVSIALGYGRTVAGRIAKGTGFNAYRLRPSNGLTVTTGSIKKLDKTYTLATTQEHGSLEGRPIYKESSLTGYKENPDFATEVHHPVPPMVSSWPERKYDTGNQWGMAIDLSKCTGCNACLIACQSENNIPVVGKDQVSNGREMHWIRLDRYFEGDIENPTMVQQPMTCLQCENAPCEQVCPVAATVHSEEGLNDMVYNRCIGTKYCSNNCPVKVRRFNFFDFHQRNPQSVAKERVHFFDYMREPDKTVQMQFNPNVSIRMRGVMEKCTYCVQRISDVRIKAKNEVRDIRDGEIKSACMQTCPSDAIVFGNINDPNSRVAKLKKNNRNYTILNDLHLKARTSYLAAVRNPHPKLVKVEEGKA